MRHTTSVFLAAIALTLLAGCASPWERSFSSSGASAPKAVAAPRLREIPWERMRRTLDSLDEALVASDVHYEDWPDAQKAEHKARLLRGLQVGDDPGTVEVLGQSQFRTTEGVNLSDLAAFGKRLGATTVVHASRHLGKADTVRSEPVTEWRTGTWTGRRADGSRVHGDSSETVTTWVPVRVQADEYGYIAFYLFEAAR